MTPVENFCQRLLAIKEKILNTPYETIVSGTFDEEEKILSSLLEEVKTFSEADRQVVTPLIQGFSEELAKKLEMLKKQMQESEEQAKISQKQLRGVKAYSGKIF
jgi:phenylalanyl-tRNA synthetase alpha subunit